MGRRASMVLGFAWLLVVTACASDPRLPVERLRDARFVLLGELHDNPIHHRERAEWLQQLLADGRPTRVLFEQMVRGEDAAIAAAGPDVEAIASAGKLDRRAWRWPMHKPLLEAAVAGGASIGGANLERHEVRAVVRSGVDGAPADLREWLADDRWTPQQQRTLEALIDDGHCGVLPRSQWPAMALAQRARDAAMARAMLAAPGERVVLLAGNGHVRSDIGVPHYLRNAGVPAREIASVAFVEDGAAGSGPFDQVRRTAAAERPDPCAELRERPPRPPIMQ